MCNSKISISQVIHKIERPNTKLSPSILLLIGHHELFKNSVSTSEFYDQYSRLLNAILNTSQVTKLTVCKLIPVINRDSQFWKRFSEFDRAIHSSVIRLKPEKKKMVTVVETYHAIGQINRSSFPDPSHYFVDNCGAPRMRLDYSLFKTKSEKNRTVNLLSESGINAIIRYLAKTVFFKSEKADPKIAGSSKREEQLAVKQILKKDHIETTDLAPTLVKSEEVGPATVSSTPSKSETWKAEIIQLKAQVKTLSPLEIQTLLLK